VLGVLPYGDTDPNATTIGVAGNTTNPFGAETNPFNNFIWEGCDDMPFNMTLPKRQQTALNASPASTNYVQYVFEQAQNVNRIFVNTVSTDPFLGKSEH